MTKEQLAGIRELPFKNIYIKPGKSGNKVYVLEDVIFSSHINGFEIHHINSAAGYRLVVTDGVSVAPGPDRQLLGACSCSSYSDTRQVVLQRCSTHVRGGDGGLACRYSIRGCTR